MKAVHVLIAFLAGIFIAACGGSGGGAIANGDYYSKAEVDGLIADLRAEFESRLAEVGAKPYNRLYTSSNTSGMSKTGASLTEIGDPIDCEQTQANLTACRVISPTGYLAKIPLNKNPTIPGGLITMYYEQPYCQGTPYVQTGARKFVTGDREGNVYYFAPETGTVGTIVAYSYRNADHVCLEGDPGTFEVQGAFPLTPNDPEVTLFQNQYDSATTFGG